MAGRTTADGQSPQQEGRTSVSGSRRAGRRLGAMLATTVLTFALVPGVASPADTSLLSINMTQPTPVSVPDEGLGPYATMFQVQIANTGGQNLAHTVLTIAANAGAAGLSFAVKYDPDGGNDASDTFCTPSGNTITCDYASLGANASRTVAVV